MSQALENKDQAQHATTEIEGRLSEITERLSKLYPKSIDLSLERIERFLAQVDSPHLSLPPVIHVAGTNGKGSTIAYLRSIIEASGLRAHATISPHLINFNERILINGEPISTPDLMALLDECDRVNAGAPITYFEIAMAATFMAFARTESDFTLLETGLGGRLDATNVVPDPAACIITTIGYDHMDYLGNSLPDIAKQKCGIMKKGRPCVVAPQTGEAIREGVLDTIKSEASRIGARLYLYGRDWFVEETPFGFRLSHSWGIEDFPFPALTGRHQINNAAATIVAMRVIENERSEDLFRHSAICKGIASTKWPGRLQKIDVSDLPVPTSCEVWIDGGHNENAALILNDQIEGWKRESKDKVIIVLGMLSRKDPVKFVEKFSGTIDEVICIPVPHEPSSFDTGTLSGLLKDAFPELPVSEAQTADAALTMIKDEKARILITGSLYLIGDFLKNHPA